MKKFVILYHAPTPAVQQMTNATRGQMKAGMDAWMAWAQRAGNAVVDLGTPLGNTKVIKGANVINSGSGIVGYSILQAPSMDAVLALIKDHPHLHMPDFSIEIVESIPMPGM